MTINKDAASGTVSVSGTLDIDSAEPLRWALVDALAGQAAIALNLGGVEDIDTAALQVLLAARRAAAAIDKPMRWIGLAPSVAAAAAFLGFDIGGLDSAGLDAGLDNGLPGDKLEDAAA
jgi:anti-anti-sigma factor